MQYSTDLPAVWCRRAFCARDIVGLSVLGALGASAVLVAAVSAAAGRHSAAAYAAAFACMMVLVSAAGITMRRSPRPVRANRGAEGATTIAGAEATLRILVGVVALAFGACAALTVQVGMSGNLPAAIVPAALTFALGSFLGQRLRGRIDTGHLAFTATGVEQRGWTFTSGLAWDDLVGVTASYGAFREILLVARPGTDWHAAPTTRFWRIDRLPPVPMIQIDCSRYRAGSVELFEFIRFYLANPHARKELGTPVAAARLANQPTLGER